MQLTTEELAAQYKAIVNQYRALNRKAKQLERIAKAEQRARVRKIMQTNYKVQLADCVDACIQCGLIDKDLNLL